MKNRMRNIVVAGAGLLFSSLALAGADVAVVNVTDLFNKSAYVSNANKKLQDDVKQMEANLKVAQSKLQQQLNDYQNIKDNDKKKALAKAIEEKQAELNKLTKEYQVKINAAQNKGMQEFTKLVQTAVQKIAKDKGIHTVLNNTSVIYSDNTWVDITKDVEAEMAKS